MAELKGTLTGLNNLSGVLNQNNNLNGTLTNTAGQGTRNYNRLTNKPTLNSVVIEGDKISSDYKLQEEMEIVTDQNIDDIIFG